MANYNQKNNIYTIEKADGDVFEHLKLATNTANQNINERPLVLRIPDMKIEFEIPQHFTEKQTFDSYLAAWQKTQPTGVVKI